MTRTSSFAGSISGQDTKSLKQEDAPSSNAVGDILGEQPVRRSAGDPVVLGVTDICKVWGEGKVDFYEPVGGASMRQEGALGGTSTWRAICTGTTVRILLVEEPHRVKYPGW